MMKVTDFDYHLPEELIAQHPAERRELSKLLVMGRDTGDCQLRGFADFPDYVRAGDCLVVNDTRVIAARLFGRRDPSGGRVEAFVLEERGPSRWQCLLRPGRRLNSGARVILDEDAGAFVVTARLDDGTFEVEFDTADVLGLLERLHASMAAHTVDDKSRAFAAGSLAHGGDRVGVASIDDDIRAELARHLTAHVEGVDGDHPPDAT